MARDKQVNVLLTAETVEGLRAEAARGGVSLSEVVRGRIEGYPSAVADAEDWRRAALARCADAERCAELEGECERLRGEIERLRGARSRLEPPVRRPADVGSQRARDAVKKVPAAPVKRVQTFAAASDADSVSDMIARNSVRMEELRKRFGGGA